MGEAVLLKGGSGFDGNDYTAKKEDVKESKIFLGNGSDELQTGSKKVLTVSDVTLSINGTYSIQAGYHSNQQKIIQSIPTSGATSVTPKGSGQTIETAGKYWTGNVTINALENYAAQYIKKGVTVGTGDQAITGTYEGFE